MAGDQNASDAVSERPAQSEGDRQPLVSNSDMQEYQSSKMAQNAPDSGSIDKSQTSSLDFNAHRIDGYDNCEQRSSSDDAQGRPTDNYLAGTRALDAPREAPPENLSPQQQEAVKGFMEGAKGYEKDQEEFNKSGDLKSFLENGDKNNEKMRESLDRLPEKDQAGALAAINKELERDNRKVARVPETQDIYMGYINPNNPGGPISTGHRISKGPCPMS
jgi:hypothetical protein